MVSLLINEANHIIRKQLNNKLCVSSGQTIFHVG